MSSSLKNIQVQKEPIYTESVIRTAIRSSIGEKWMWIVVEDEDDMRVYKKFCSPSVTRVLPSLAENKSKSCKNVEYIVEKVRTAYTPKISGIRDADYTRYIEPPYVVPEQVYLTDERDVEMQMLASESVKQGLELWNSSIPEHLDWIYKNVTHERGCMRLISDVYKLGCSFKDDAKISHLWDSSKRTMAVNWQTTMYDDFFNNCKNIDSPLHPFSRNMYAEIKRKKSLDSASDYKICQGHDVVSLLQYMLGDNKFNSDRIMVRMTECYSLADFRRTDLYKNLKCLESKLNFHFLL